MDKKRLCKSRDGSILAGVCSGIGEYFDISPWLPRIIFLLTSGTTLIVYIIMAIMLPYGDK